jgi:hypothetical protein
MDSQRTTPKEAQEMRRINTRPTIIGLAASVSIGLAAMVPAAAQATTKQKDLKEKGYTCEHTATDMTVCTDNEGHEWYCQESTDECGQVKLEVSKGVRLPLPIVKLNAPPVSAPPPVVVSPITRAKLVA